MIYMRVCVCEHICMIGRLIGLGSVSLAERGGQQQQQQQ